MRITVLAGGVGGSRFVLGLREELRRREASGALAPGTTDVTVVVNTGDDLWLAGVRLMPDHDTLLYALAGVNDVERGWGRAAETERVAHELREWGVGWPWFTLGDLDLGTHLARTAWLREGLTPSQVAARLQHRWELGVRLIPATDTEVDLHVEVADADAPGGSRTMHFQEWWTRYRASLPAIAFHQQRLAEAVPAPGVVEAILGADAVLVAPSNPVVSIGTILSIPGIREALAETRAPVVGVSPIIGGAVVRGMADACLPVIGVETDAGAVARHYGARAAGGLLDGWLVDETDAPAAAALSADGLRAEAVPLWMRDPDTSAALAGAALDLAAEIGNLRPAEE
ncbi:2-phospho-L-lactate transferase [Agromyces aerolatus]|uniref:2-phospho-L-lactate transferase n=1 Tax=Agromyces sp. LY-1074 TaxID=3074080 RepID=UPI00285B6003|nr:MULTISPECIES: 2-phospho-L-lactate transferase [unclassified Agromyces]MDR5701162.1 2-phospho-L-lactate transferase [Agromyces sp. LY-1074]MDR5707802.1 2-phospho-L-lactate transferase [Agromyces sp. LY-1358]